MALADRAWERIPVLQRRRASLFEPVQGTHRFEHPSPEQEWFAGNKAIEPRPSLRARHPEMTVDARRTAKPVGEIDNRPAGLHPHQTSTPGSAARAFDTREGVRAGEAPRLETIRTTHHTVATVTRSVVERVVEKEVHHRAPAPALQRAAGEQPGALKRGAREAATEARLPETRARTTEEARLPKPARRSTSEPDPTAVLPSRVTRFAERTGTSQPQPFVQRRAGRAPQPPASASAPAPSVQVSIGLIEVRAIPAGAAPRKPPRTRGPALGLDEYLRSRTGGGR